MTKRNDETQKRETQERRGWTPRIFRLLRATAATAVVVTAFGFIALRTSYARASDAGMSFGDELLHLGQHNPSGEVKDSVYELSINGQQAETTNGFTRRPMKEVLDYFKTQCDEHGQGLADKFANLDTSLVDLEPASGAPGYAAIRSEKPSQGYVFCAALDHAPTKSETLAHFQELVRTGDLASLGGIRYVAVEEVEGGSHVVAAWTQGKFNMYAMFPKEGDAPGDDFSIAPRPEGSRRLFAGRLGAATYGLNIYEAKGNPDTVFQDVDAKLKAAGWKPTPVFRRVPQVGHAYSMGEKFDILVNINQSSPTTSSATYVVSEMPGAAIR
jgi:hypothetical protein